MGYVLKDAAAAEVAATIRPISWGAELGLSRREQQLIHLLRERLTNKEIAAQLNLSEQNVKNHVHNIMRKVGANDLLSAVRRCEMERFRSEATGS